MPRVSIIIVTFNNISMLDETIQSILNQTYNDFEIVVIDNNSTDRTYEFVKNKFPDIVCIKTDENIGFAAGNNTGLRFAHGEYIALLNNDAAAQPTWLEAIVRAMDSGSDIGICASKMLRYGTGLIDSAGDGFSANLKGYKRGEGEDKLKYDRQEYVFGACAGAALYRQKMVEEIGFFDDDFFLIHEDTDLNLRAQLAGWKVLYVPTAVVYHKVRSSIGHMSDTAVYYTLRNSEFVRIKSIPCSILLRCLPEFIIGTITEFLYFALKHRKLRLYIKAKLDVLKALPKMLRKRRTIMMSKKVSSGYLYSIMTPVWSRDFIKLKVEKFFKN